MCSVIPDLRCNALHTGKREIGLVPMAAVVLLELIQIGTQQLTYQEQVFLQSPHDQLGTCKHMSRSLLPSTAYMLSRQEWPCKVDLAGASQMAHSLPSTQDMHGCSHAWSP